MSAFRNVAQSWHQEALSHALTRLSIPQGYELKNTSSVMQDNDAVWVFRYEKSDGRNNGLGGEHFSFTVTQVGFKILGVMWMNQDFAEGRPLTTEAQTRKAVQKFLRQVEPGLFESAEHRWIRPKEFELASKGKKITLAGMRYKFHTPAENKRGWVVVAPGGEVIAFEQDMLWNEGRISEKWLHDDWLASGAQNDR